MSQMTSKVHQSETIRSRQSASAHQKGTSVSPPSYGIDFIDHGMEKYNATLSNTPFARQKKELLTKPPVFSQRQIGNVGILTSTSISKAQSTYSNNITAPALPLAKKETVAIPTISAPKMPTATVAKTAVSPVTNTSSPAVASASVKPASPATAIGNHEEPTKTPSAATLAAMAAPPPSSSTGASLKKGTKSTTAEAISTPATEIVKAAPIATAPEKLETAKADNPNIAQTETKVESTESNAEAIGGEKAKTVDLTVKLHIPEPPSGISPKTAKRIQVVQANASKAATAHSTLPSGASQVGAARQAVTEPDAEATAKAQAELIKQVQAAPSPEIVKLCEHIREVIRNKRPPDQDALMEAKPEGEALEAGNQLNTAVEGETKKVQDNYATVNKPPAAVTPTKGQDLPPQPPVIDTPAINAQAATPDAVPPESVSLDADVEDSKKKMQDAGMNAPSARLVQSGPIAEARGVQGELDQTAKEDPAKILAGQQETLSKAEGDMATLQAQALTVLTKSRTATTKSTLSQQTGMVGSEETMRTGASTEAKKIFEDAKNQVTELLKPLASNAMKEWDSAKDVLTTQFKKDLSPVQKRIDERHSGITGFAVGLWDAATGLPSWAEEGYSNAEKNFGDGVINKLTSISTKVNSVILTCDLIIKNARDRITKIFNDLPASLQDWAKQEQTRFDGQLDQLHSQVITARNNFNKDLISRSSQAVDDVRGQIAELRKKAAGLLGRIANAIGRFLDDPVKFIIEGLLELVGIQPAAFWAVIAKIKKFAKDIADDAQKFTNNLFSGLGQGFTQFFDNFGTHLLKGFVSWLTGGLSNVGVQLPKDFTLKSVITFFLQLMGITWPRIRKVLAKQIGEKNIALLEKVYSLVSFLMNKGPEGIYEMIKEKLDPQSIVDQVIQLAVDFLVSAIIKQVAVRIVMLFNPVGAIFQALEAIYRVLKWIFQNAARIFTLIETVVNGIGDILAGNIGGFAKAVEKALGMLIAPVIAFIADYLSLGDLPAKIAEKIKSFQDWVMGLVEKALVWIIEKGKSLLNLAGKGLGAAKAWWEDRETFTSKDGHDHKLYYKGEGASAELIIQSDPTSFQNFLNDETKKNEANPKGDAKTDKAKKIQEAQSIFDELKQLQKQPSATAKPAGEEGGATKTPDTTINGKIVDLTNKLGKLAADILSGDNASTPPNYGGLINGFGSSVTVEKLTSKHAPGSEPSVTSTLWDTLNLRRKGSGSYYVRGHLLNHWLGGSGETWANLTPITRNANSNMSSQFEEHAKGLVIPKSDNQLKFAVNVDYAHGSNAKLLKEIDDIEKAGSGSGGSLEKNILVNMKKLIEAEGNLPSKVTCEYKVTAGKDKDKALGPKPFENTIEENSLDQYHMVGKDYDPKVGFNNLMVLAKQAANNNPDMTWTAFKNENGTEIAMLEKFAKGEASKIQDFLTQNMYFQKEKQRIGDLKAPPYPSWEKFQNERVAYSDKLNDEQKFQLKSLFIETTKSG
ncbi:MAG: hypothetical protein RLZZ419_1869 [Pseudomonadota bacterium]